MNPKLEGLLDALREADEAVLLADIAQPPESKRYDAAVAVRAAAREAVREYVAATRHAAQFTREDVWRVAMIADLLPEHDDFLTSVASRIESQVSGDERGHEMSAEVVTRLPSRQGGERMSTALRIDADVTATLDRWVAAIGTPDHKAASEALDTLLVERCIPKSRANVGDIVRGWWDGLPNRCEIKRRAWNPDAGWWEYDLTNPDADLGYWTAIRENDNLEVLEASRDQ